MSGVDHHEYAGGKGLNQAVAAARAGASVALVGSVGDDDAGAVLRTLVVEEGIDDRWLVTTTGSATGRAMILVEEGGENSIVIVPGANGSARWPSAPPHGRVLLAQLEIPLDVVVEAAAGSAGSATITILDPAPARPLTRTELGPWSIVVPNEHEVDVLGGSGALIEAGVATVVITRGGAGVEVVRPDGTTAVDAHPAHPVDTTGAGDAFRGYLAARLAFGDHLASAVSWGAAAGALATTVEGAVPSLPTSSMVGRSMGRSSQPG